MVRKIKKSYKVLIGFILGVLVSGVGVYAVTKLSSSDVLYDNSKSGGNSSDVQGALEELYEKSSKCTTGSCSLTESNFFVGYTYNEDKNAADYCVLGSEATCVRTDCYTSSKKICPPGTIIDYIVSGTNTRVRFHVISDKGKKIVMQTQTNTVRNVAWYSASRVNTKGPLTIISQLEKATVAWSNVEDQTYTMGETVFSTNSYTGCNDSECSNNTYTWQPRTAKARMITYQEAKELGCNVTPKSCPIWMVNYLYQSNSLGGAVVGDTTQTSSTYLFGYHTMSASSDNTIYAYAISRYGGIEASGSHYVNSNLDGARAVIEVSK